MGDFGSMQEFAESQDCVGLFFAEQSARQNVRRPVIEKLPRFEEGDTPSHFPQFTG